MTNDPDGRQAEDPRVLRHRARREQLKAHRGVVGGVPDQLDVLEGPGFLYRPRQVLYQTGIMQTQPLQSELDKRGGHADHALTTRFQKAGLPVGAYLMPPGVSIPDLVAELRQHEDGQPTPNIAPNHVFCGEPDYQGGPSGPPSNAPSFPEDPYATRQVGPGIAVLDTGYDLSDLTLHVGLRWRVAEVGGIDDPLTAGGYFAPEAGHGTFIDGILMRLAPDVPLRQVKVLDPYGVTDDACVALAMVLEADAPVINLSLGGYTQGDVPPIATGFALALLADTVAVVAAAGNNASYEPFWPAAFKGVVAVGALDTTQSPPPLAGFSNYGQWVDIYAPGVNVYSTYLQGTWEETPPNPPATWPIDGYAIWNGTSFAAPQVAAAIADTLRQTPGITPRQAALMVLGAAPWQPGVGPVYIPFPGVIG